MCYCFQKKTKVSFLKNMEPWYLKDSELKWNMLELNFYVWSYYCHKLKLNLLEQSQMFQRRLAEDPLFHLHPIVHFHPCTYTSRYQFRIFLWEVNIWRWVTLFVLRNVCFLVLSSFCSILCVHLSFFGRSYKKSSITTANSTSVHHSEIRVVAPSILILVRRQWPEPSEQFNDAPKTQGQGEQQQEQPHRIQPRQSERQTHAQDKQSQIY